MHPSDSWGMNTNNTKDTDRSSQSPSQQEALSSRPLRSKRASPPSTATPDRGAMATPSFLLAAQTYRSALPAHSPFAALNVSTGHSHLFEREPPEPVSALFCNSPASVRVLIRRLPLNTSEESLRFMVVWCEDLLGVELLPAEQSEDIGFRCAILRFKSMSAALEVKNMIDGCSNISNDAEMVVEILTTTPVMGRRLNPEVTSANPSGLTTASRPPPQRFNGAFPPLERVSPTSNGMFTAHEFPNLDADGHYHNVFSPRSPIGNHIAERGTRVSGKTLINSDFGDDDETRNLLNDPVAYAENGAASQRRATAPQIPISQMAALSLNTSNPPGPSSLPPYIHSMSPVNATSPSLTYPGEPYGRHSFPPVNPADQNPPCNTLYVGNLPIDTSEEELKAMFSKQRGYKRLCFRTKQNGPMCFVEFEDISFATKALKELYGRNLHNSIKGGIRLSFSKNPLGVRSGQTPAQAPQGGMAAMNGMMPGLANGFTSASGPPPGLTAPPGLGTGRGNYNVHGGVNTGANHRHNSGFAGGQGHPWNAPVYQNGTAPPAYNGVAYSGAASVYQNGGAPAHNGAASVYQNGAASIYQNGAAPAHNGGASIYPNGAASIYQNGGTATHNGGASIYPNGAASVYQNGGTATHNGASSANPNHGRR